MTDSPKHRNTFTQDANLEPPKPQNLVEQVKADGVTQLVILPLYPQFSISTSGSSFRLLEKLLKEDSVLSSLKHTVIPSWYQRAGYVNAQVS